MSVPLGRFGRCDLSQRLARVTLRDVTRPGRETCRRRERLADTIGFEILGKTLGRDVRSAIRAALKAGVRFHGPARSSAIFRNAVDASIREIEGHPRGTLFQRFLRDGPYERPGPIPRDLAGKRLSDQETASAITFIYSHMVNCFKGHIAELLASRPCSDLVEQLRDRRRLPRPVRLYVGDVVGVGRLSGPGIAKGADMHIIDGPETRDFGRITVAGVVEVKSYRCSQRRLSGQLDRHLQRLGAGLRVGGRTFTQGRVKLLTRDPAKVIRIGVVPASWKLPQRFHFEPTDNGRRLCIDPGSPVADDDQVERIGPDEWRITLRWSAEALASAAYEMTFWYMERVGEIIYALDGVPKDWSEMTPADAGRNAAKMMLYYAILRCRSQRESQRAIALYNAYSFGYSLGMNFRNAEGRREMLWPEDLDEIAQSGKTRHGSRISRPRRG